MKIGIGKNIIKTEYIKFESEIIVVKMAVLKVNQKTKFNL